MRRRGHERTELKCVSCGWHKPPDDFREMPWHGRAASCIRCETFPGPDGRSLWQIEHDERTHWDLVQAREKLRMWQRYASWLKGGGHYRHCYVMGMGQPPSTAVRPWERVMEARRRKWAPLVEEALHKAHTLSEEDFR
ncbi:hypothetical protein OG709_30010 [Streptomyces sp. NBC_01267]|uniref:hypothetical protein n=1 Tax=Streptomyces sp. NBC_01267 TaxID=2903805 RepID=UPI002E320011|nr:hypothetical protein [Streptomyces sp. NBC_01267]